MKQMETVNINISGIADACNALKYVRSHIQAESMEWRDQSLQKQKDLAEVLLRIGSAISTLEYAQEVYEKNR